MAGGGIGLSESLKTVVKMLKEEYLRSQGREGGTAEGFRQFGYEALKNEKHRWAEAVYGALDLGWRAQPRKVGPDLFSIGMVNIPEYLTRKAELDGDGDEEIFEQVHHLSATVKDLMADASIKRSKAEQVTKAAGKRLALADEALARARGDESMLLRDLAD
jgi:hypothetical protein